MTGFIFGLTFGGLLIAWLSQRIGSIKTITDYKPGGPVEFAVGPKTRFWLLWEAVAPWLAFVGAVGLGWVLRGGC